MDPVVLEFCYKNDELGDPMVNTSPHSGGQNWPPSRRVARCTWRYRVNRRH